MISIDRLKRALNITTDDYDTRLAEMLDRARAIVESLTGRYFGPVAEVIEYIRGQGIRNLWLTDLPTEADDYAEILVSEYTWQAAGLAAKDAEARQLQLKGRSEPVQVRVLQAVPLQA
jgi:hypothetical protein